MQFEKDASPLEAEVKEVVCSEISLLVKLIPAITHITNVMLSQDLLSTKSDMVILLITLTTLCIMVDPAMLGLLIPWFPLDLTVSSLRFM